MQRGSNGSMGGLGEGGVGVGGWGIRKSEPKNAMGVNYIYNTKMQGNEAQIVGKRNQTIHVTRGIHWHCMSKEHSMGKRSKGMH